MFLDTTLDNNARISPIEPAWKAVKKKTDDYITWFQETGSTLQYQSEARIQTMVNNLLWYTGEYDRTAEYRISVPGRGDTQIPRKILPRIFNHLHDITEQRVSKLSRIKPSFDTVPTNKEEKDRLVARLMKYALDAMARRVQIEFLFQEIERWTAVFGECYIGVEWNKNIGDRQGKDTYERVGDVDVYLKAPWTVFPEPKRHWGEVGWCFDIESIMHIEEARKRFNRPKLQPDGKLNIFEFNADMEEKRSDEVVVWRVICPPSEFLPEGNIRYLINDTIVDDIKEYPYSHFEFPFERHTDLDVPGRLFPQSFYQQVKPIQNVYNKLTSLITRNILLVGHPHILMPKGAAKIESFGNTHTAIEYSGPTAPQIVTFNSVPAEAFQFRNEVKAEMGQVSGIQGVSRGAPPPGARAASMLRFYEEQEEQRASTQIIKRNELIRRVYLKSGSVIADYYPTTSKKRLIRVVGKQNEYDIQAFDNEKFSTEYDVIIVNSTGFSESKSIRMEEIKTLKEISPSILTDDQVADIMEFKNVQKMYDIATAAIKQAEDEGERFLDGRDVTDPKPYQDLIVHWRTHMIQMNTSTWENTVPPKIKQKMEDHMLMTEKLMEDKAKLNQAFAQILSALPGYPAFWIPTPQLPEATAKAQQPFGMPQNGNALPMPGGQVPPPEGGGGSPIDALMQAGQGAEPSPFAQTSESLNVPSALGDIAQ